MSIAEDVKNISFTDLVEDNLNEIRGWKMKSKQSFNWKPFFKIALMLKNDTARVNELQINRLEDILRKKIVNIQHCNIFQKDLGIKGKKFDIINTHFVAESATKSKAKWKYSIKNMYSKLNKGGLLFMSALKGAKGEYRVLNKKFPAVELYEKDIKKALKEAKFKLIRISSINTEDRSNGYEGFMFIVANK